MSDAKLRAEAIVRRGRQQDQRVGAAKPVFSARRAAATCPDPWRAPRRCDTIDEIDVHQAFSRIVAVLEVILQGVDGDDAASK